MLGAPTYGADAGMRAPWWGRRTGEHPWSATHGSGVPCAQPRLAAELGGTRAAQSTSVPWDVSPSTTALSRAGDTGVPPRLAVPALAAGCRHVSSSSVPWLPPARKMQRETPCREPATAGGAQRAPSPAQE